MNSVRIRPLGARALVRPMQQAESIPNAGIFLTSTSKEKVLPGEIIAIGDAEEEIKVKAGQKVLFTRFGGAEIKLDGVEYILLEMKDILAIIEE